MPVRSLTASVLRWPDAKTVREALRSWASAVSQADGDVQAIGYFGSYARGDWGVGSDLDVLIIVAHSDTLFERRSLRWDTTSLPVPVDLLVYTQAEWRRLNRRGKFGRVLQQEIVWSYSTATVKCL